VNQGEFGPVVFFDVIVLYSVAFVVVRLGSGLG
jgi:hypothetical protein